MADGNITVEVSTQAATAELRRLRVENAALKRDLEYARGGLTKGRTRMREDVTRLQAEVEQLREAIELLIAERDALKETLHNELDGNLRLRDLGGARPDECMTTFLERVFAERDGYAALLRQALEALEAECAWGGPTPRTAAAIAALREQLVAFNPEDRSERVALAERERWERALKQTWQAIDPLKPAGQPGSYARGYDNGFAAALQVLRGNLGA